MTDSELVYKLVEFLKRFDAMSYDEQVKITVDDTLDAIGVPANLRSDLFFEALLVNAKRIIGEDTSKLDSQQNERMSKFKAITTKISVAATFMRQKVLIG